MWFIVVLIFDQAMCEECQHTEVSHPQSLPTTTNTLYLDEYILDSFCQGLFQHSIISQIDSGNWFLIVSIIDQTMCDKHQHTNFQMTMSNKPQATHSMLMNTYWISSISVSSDAAFSSKLTQVMVCFCFHN